MGYVTQSIRNLIDYLIQMKFEKRHMLELEQISFPHLQWIYYREALDCIDSTGQRVQMEHAFHRGEIEFKGLKPDGYLFKDGKHHFYEFQGNNFYDFHLLIYLIGCYWHGCHCIPRSKWHRNAEGRQGFFREKMAVFRAHGEVHLMRECEWKRQLQTMEKPTTQMGRILHEDNQETLYQAILDETVFGFIKCDVETPREMIESFGEFLFPPLFCRMQVTSDLVSDYMKQRMCEDDNLREPTTIVQRYNAKGIYLLTPLVKFYISRGMKVSNITEFNQYIGGEAFESFVDTCYRERVAATKAGDDTKANTIKNVQNNGN